MSQGSGAILSQTDRLQQLKNTPSALAYSPRKSFFSEVDGCKLMQLNDLTLFKGKKNSIKVTVGSLYLYYRDSDKRN